MAKVETLDELIRMSVRVQSRLRNEGIELRFSIQPVPCEKPPSLTWTATAQKPRRKSTRT